jgi:phage terminase large subunit
MSALPQIFPGEEVKISDFYSPWPKQQAFHSMKAKHRLQIGGFGSAKSRALLMEAVITCLEYPGINAIILRKTMPDLKRTVIDKFEADVPRYVYEKGSQEKGTFNKSDHIVYLPPVMVIDSDPETLKVKLNPTYGEPLMVWRQSKLYFAACETERDIGKYLSTEFAFVGFEELGEFPYIIYDAMEGRNRTPIPGCTPRMGAATNPMGIGWSWIKKVFIEKLPCQGMDPESYDPSDYSFVHSTIEDNPLLWRDKKYVQSLEKSPLRQKIRWGKLDSTTGQYFDNWDVSRHVRPANDFIFEAWQPVWAGWDYGFSSRAFRMAPEDFSTSLRL